MLYPPRGVVLTTITIVITNTITMITTITISCVIITVTLLPLPVQEWSELSDDQRMMRHFISPGESGVRNIVW